MTTRATTGLVIGKFMPLHRGHEILFAFARQCCDELTIVVDRLAGQETSPETRARHVREVAGCARVAPIAREMPQAPLEHPLFWEVWRDELIESCGGKAPDVLVASMDYGVPLSRALGARFVPFDFERSMLDVSSTAIRADPFGLWPVISAPARELYVRRLCLMGPESTGKSVCAQAVASKIGAGLVPEYAKTLIAAKGGRFTAEDAIECAMGQQRSERVALGVSGPLMILDSDPLTTLAWSLTLFGSAPEELERLAAKSPAPDLTMLFDPSVPWTSDVHRRIDPRSGTPESRESFFHLCTRMLEHHGRRFEVVGGSYEKRFDQVMSRALGLIALGPKSAEPLWSTEELASRQSFRP